MTPKDLTGIWTALSTPFNRMELDERSFKRLLKFQGQQGVDGFVVNGTTGESPTLLKEEVEKLFEWTSECSEEKPIIMGIGGNNTLKTQLSLQWASEQGASAFLAVVPYYNKPPQRGLIKHFQALASAGREPVILYNVPARTGQGLSLESIVQLSQHPNIIGIKEASGDLDFGQQIIEQTNPEEFSVLSGDDDTGLELCAMGAKGIISVVSHIIGREIKLLLKQIKEGGAEDQKKALAEYKEKYGLFLKALYAETNPIGVKMALKLRGIFEKAQMRLPLVEMEEKKAQKLQGTLQKLF